MPEPQRAAFAVLALPYALEADGDVRYAVFRPVARPHRPWHVLAGDGVGDETPMDAARRTARRLAAVAPEAPFVMLDSRATVDVADGPRGVPEHAFGVRVAPDALRPRQLDHRWVAYEVADGLLLCDAMRSALWELRDLLERPTTLL